MNRDHQHILIIGLVYPAFLGAFMFEAVESLGSLSLTQVLLLIAIILHYVGDFVFTAEDCIRKIYNPVRMVCDLALVALLYAMLTFALNSPLPTDISMAWLTFAGTKAICLLWEWAGRPSEDRAIATKVDVVFAAAYMIGFWVCHTWVAALIVVIFLDAALYLTWNSFVARSRAGKQESSREV